MASAPMAAWRRMKTGIAQQVNVTIEGQLSELSGRLVAVEARLAELGAIVETLVDVENQSTELMGRLLQGVASRMDDLEERARRAP